MEDIAFASLKKYFCEKLVHAALDYFIQSLDKVTCVVAVLGEDWGEEYRGVPILLKLVLPRQG